MSNPVAHTAFGAGVYLMTASGLHKDGALLGNVFEHQPQQRSLLTGTSQSCSPATS